MRNANIALAVAFAAAFLYWDVRERLAPRAHDTRLRHPPATRRTLRVLLPALTLVLILQLLGVFRLPLSASNRLVFVVWILGHFLAWVGLAYAVWTREVLGRHWAHAADYQVIPGQALVTQGPYRFVRHPIYTGLLAAFLGGELAAGSWLVFGALPLYILMRWQVGREEIILRENFNPAYEEYRRRTGRFFPSIFRSQ